MISLEHFSCVADIFRYQSKTNGSCIAQVFEGRETTYEELDTFANKVANGLLNNNCGSGTRVGFLGKNSDHYFEILAGSSKANVVIAGVNWRLAGPEIEYCLLYTSPSPRD